MSIHGFKGLLHVGRQNSVDIKGFIVRLNQIRVTIYYSQVLLKFPYTVKYHSQQRWSFTCVSYRNTVIVHSHLLAHLIMYTSNVIHLPATSTSFNLPRADAVLWYIGPKKRYRAIYFKKLSSCFWINSFIIISAWTCAQEWVCAPVRTRQPKEAIGSCKAESETFAGSLHSDLNSGPHDWHV